MTLNFDELEEARKTPRSGFPRGHTIDDLCRKVGISVSAYHKIKAGTVTNPHKMTVKALESYIRSAARLREKAAG